MNRGSTDRRGSAQASLDLETLAVDVRRLVKFTAFAIDDSVCWRVAGGEARWRDRVGRQIGVIEVRNARAHGIVLDLGGGQVACFHPMDLFPVVAGGEQ